MSLIAYLLGYFTQLSYFLPLFTLICLFLISKNVFLNGLFFITAIVLSQAHESHIKIQKNGLNQVSKVLSFPQQKGSIKQYRLSYGHQMISLACWKNCPNMYPGERWQWTGKLKAIETYHNFYDHALWYEPHYRHLVASVFVDGHTLKRIAEIAPDDWINRIRKKIYSEVNAKMPSQEVHFARALFLTLILGLGSELDASEWTLFKNTGIVHLMVVSGAHFNLLLALVMQLLGLIYWVVPNLARFIPRQAFVTSIALVLGLIYAAISGFGIPIQRAWIMSCVRFLPFLGCGNYSVWQGMRWSIYIILAMEPHAIFYPGAYLSYIAVIALILAEEVIRKISRFKLLLSQLLCNAFMMPLCFLWFGQFPLLALIVNFFAIPWVSYVFLPMVFLNSLLFLLDLPPLMMGFFAYNSQLFESILNILQRLPVSTLHLFGLSAIDAFAFLGALLMCILLPTLRFRLLAMSLFFLSLSGERLKLNSDEFQADIIDVGQGLAILLHTQHHHLLYDLGPKKAAYYALLPYLKTQKNNDIDGMVLSHHDADHIGGLDPILQEHPHLPMIVDNIEKYAQYKQKKINCHELEDWVWDGVRFSFLKYAKQHASKNNHSCVLKISNQQFSLLLPGDIEASAEKRLLKFYGNKLRAQVLVLAHHGSHSSSTGPFIRAVKPQLGVISYGRYNPYGHPHQDIVQRLKSLHIPLVSTGIDGMIRLYFLRTSWQYQSYNTLF